MSHFHTEATDLPVCPACGFEFHDANTWGMFGRGVGRKCGACGAEFWATHRVAVSYTTGLMQTKGKTAST